MEEKGLHPGLEMRLRSLASRIAELKQRMNRAQPLEKVSALGEVTQLEQRYARLEEQLRGLNAEGPGFRQNAKAEFEKMADDLASNLQDFLIRLDSSDPRR